MTAHEALSLAVMAALDAGLRVPCLGSRLWTSDSPDERAQAAVACDGCPTWNPCADAADEAGEKHGVWAGRDRSPRTGAARGGA